MPFKAPPFDVYRSLLRMVSPFPAFRTKWNCPGGELLSTYLHAIFLLPAWMSTPAQPRANGLAPDRGHFPNRPEERREGKELVSKCRYRWSTHHKKKNRKNILILPNIKPTY